MSKKTLEIMVGEIESLRAAIDGGADRIELCSHPAGGGLTPSPGYFQTVKRMTTLPVFVLIRPHAGGFQYTGEEIACMEKDIQYFRDSGADGIVCGFLDENNKVDEKLTKRFVELTHPLPFTFHRAIDDCADMSEGVQKIINAGCTRVLTSGGKINASEGIRTIEKLVSMYGHDIIIMPGSGINAQNINLFLDAGADEFHTSAGKHIVSPERFPEPLFHRKQRKITDEGSVRAIRNILDKY